MSAATERARQLVANVEDNGNWPAPMNAELIAAAPGIITDLLNELDARTNPDLASRCAVSTPDHPQQPEAPDLMAALMTSIERARADRSAGADAVGSVQDEPQGRT